MAELAVIMSMITVTSTAASVLGVIKRRRGASQTIIELASNCAELVEKIRTLLKTLEGDAQVPCDARRISTALNLRCEEFDAVLKKLERFKQLTKGTHPIDRTEKFIKSQGWAKRMEAIYNNLVHLRNGIENIASNWDAAQFLATKFDEIVTIDVTKREGSGNKEQHSINEVMESSTVNYVDRIQMAMVRLTDANKEALNQYGNLERLSLPDAMYEAGFWVKNTDKTCYIQLMQRSAELLNPAANYWMGIEYKQGGIVEKNLNLALFHFRLASSSGEIFSRMELITHYDHEDTENVSKYVKTASGTAPLWISQILNDVNMIDQNLENGKLKRHLIRASQSMCALNQSYRHFHGFDAPKSNRKAIEALPTFDSGSYSVHLDTGNSTSFDICFHIRPHFYGWHYPDDLMCEYLDFLSESNQFLPFFIWSSDADIYSLRRWKRSALHAAKNCSVDAHIFLAEYYSCSDHRNEREMKRHLRIAADAGLSQAQSICRQLFGKNAKVCKGVKRVEKRRDDDPEKQTHIPRAKQSKNEGDSRKKRAFRASKKSDVATK